MSDEIRQLAHAIKALAESNQGIGGVLREVVATQRETNRILGEIHDQNADIAAQMESFNSRHSGSEKSIRELKSTVNSHGERLVTIEQVIGITHPAAE